MGPLAALRSSVSRLTSRMSKGTARARKRPAQAGALPQGENSAQQTVYVRLAGQRRFYRRAVTVEEVGGARCLVVRKEATGKLRYTASLDGAAALAQSARLKLIIQPATGADLELRFSSRSALKVWCDIVARRPTGAKGPAGSSSSPAVPQAGSGVRVHFVDEPASERETLADAEEDPREDKRAANGVFLDDGLWRESAYAAETPPVYFSPRSRSSSRMAIARRGSPRASSSRMSVDEPISPAPPAQAASQESKGASAPAPGPSSRCCVSCSSSAESVDEGAIGLKPRARAAAAAVAAAGPAVATRAGAEAVAVLEPELQQEGGAGSGAPLAPWVSEALAVAEDEAAVGTELEGPSSLPGTPRGDCAEELVEAGSSASCDEAASAAEPEEETAAEDAAAAEEAGRAAFVAAAERAAAAEAARLVAAGAAASARLAAAAAEAERYTAAAAARAAAAAAAEAALRLAAHESAKSAAPTAESIASADAPPPRLSSASSTSSAGSLEPSDEAGWTAEALAAAVAASARGGGPPMATLGEVPPGVRLLLSPSLLGALSEALPRTLRLRPWRLAFSTESDGCSLQTLLRRLEGRAESVLLVRDAEGALFGAFLSEAWRAGPRYFGTGESFLFSARRPGEPSALTTYRWTRANACFAHADHTGLAFGGPACGLALDKSLEAGSSKRSETYANAPLAGSADFVCLKLEVWSLER